MGKWTRERVAAAIDHAALKPYMTDNDIIAACELGKRYRVATVCVRPSDVALAVRELAGSGVKTSIVVGFPHGAHRPETKALETRLAIQNGAKELDMVMNMGKYLSGDVDWVRRDMDAVIAEARVVGDVVVKVILETCYLSPKQIAEASRIARDAGADYVKSSTGFGDGPATPEAVEVMIRAVGDTMGVKASGGIRCYETARKYLEQGCTRLGSSSGTAAIVGEAPLNEGEAL